MGFFEENKALIITVLLFSILILLMYNIRLSNADREFKEMLVDLEQLEPEDLPDEEEREEQQPEEAEIPAPQETTVRTHQAFNQNTEETSENFQDRLNQIFEKNAAEQTASEEEDTETGRGEYNITRNTRNRAQQQSDGNNTSRETSTNTGSLADSSISYSLVGRSAVEIPNPIYTCDVSGKIVVNIVVNADGFVTDTSINKGSSTSDNQCLRENALLYAAGAVFSRLPGRNRQKGTITYYFQG